MDPYKPERTSSGLYLSDKLVGQDNRIDRLSNLFEGLQLATVETSHPTLDLLSFSENALFFAVILKERPPQSPPQRIIKEESNKRKRNFPSDTRFVGKQSEALLANIDAPKAQVHHPILHQSKRIKAEPSNTGTSPQILGSSVAQTVNQNIWSDDGEESALSDQRAEQNLWSTDLVDLNFTKITPHHYSAAIEEGEHHNDLSGLNNTTHLQDNLNFFPSEFRFEPETNNGFDVGKEAIGLVYLVNANSIDDPLRANELNIGIILEPTHRGHGYAGEVIDMVLAIAFNRFMCHRVQAILPDHIAKDRAICLFTRMRFDHEGTRRRAFYSPMEQIYKDVTYMGMLDTDWVLRESRGIRARVAAHSAPKSVWDELLIRHQREREELLNWQDKQPELWTRPETPKQSYFQRIWIADEYKVDEAIDDIEADKLEFSLQEGYRTSSESDTESVRSVSPTSTLSSSGSAWDVVDPSDTDSECLSVWSLDSEEALLR